MMGKALAFFDFDGTIIHGSSMVRFIFFLIREDIISFWHAFFLSFPVVMKYLVFGRSEKDLKNIIRKYAEGLKGFRVKKLERLARQWFLLERNELVHKVVKRIRQHRKKGDRLVIITAAPKHLVMLFANFLGFDELHATKFGKRKGKFTGKTKGKIYLGKDKKKLAREIARKRGVPLSQCYAYGNSFYDMEMLELVGNSYAINPGSKLIFLLRKKKKKIMVL